MQTGFAVLENARGSKMEYFRAEFISVGSSEQNTTFPSRKQVKELNGEVKRHWREGWDS